MNKKEFAAAIAEDMNITKIDANIIVDSFLNVLTDKLAEGETIKFVGFGTFGTRRLEARNGTNPYDGSKIKIPATTKPYFKPGKILKESV